MNKSWLRYPLWLVIFLLLTFVVGWTGTLIHESGHWAVAAITGGARLQELNVLLFDLYPAFRFHYVPGYYGYVRFDRHLAPPYSEMMSAAGSLSTLLVALLAQALIWFRLPCHLLPRLLAFGFSFSWLDLLYHTLPTMSWQPPFFARQVAERAEAYNALVTLGLPGWWLGAATLGISLLLFGLTATRGLKLLREGK